MGSLPRYVQRMNSSVHSGVLGYTDKLRTFSGAYPVRRLKQEIFQHPELKDCSCDSCGQPMNVAVQ
jgi:hypothetical protein